MENFSMRWKDCNSTLHQWCKRVTLKSHSLFDIQFSLYYDLSEPNYGFYCQARWANFMYVPKKPFVFSTVEGPERVLLRSLQCTNIVYDGITSSGHVLHFLFGGRRIQVRGCSVTVITPNCLVNTSKDMQLPTLGFGNWTAEVFTLFLKDANSSSTCEVNFPCINKDRQLPDGGYTLKGYFVWGLTRPGHTSRKLMSLSTHEPEDDCGAHSHLKRATNHYLIRDFKDGPGSVISICNGTKFYHGRMPESLGCYSVRSIQTSHYCKHKEASCTVEPELKDCSHGKCVMIRMSTNGIVRMVRGSTVETTKCGKECLLPPLDGEGDILIDCPGGTQHFLQKNIVDLNCPNYGKMKELMLYVCRMSHRPRTVIFLFVWISVGYIFLSLMTTLLFYCLKGICKLVELIKKKFQRKGTCDICKIDYSGEIAQNIHEANCKHGLCPFCSNRLPESNICKHAKYCPKRQQAEAGLKEYEEYRATPRVFVLIFGISEYSGTFIKRVWWVLVALVLVSLVLSPVKGNDLSFEGWEDSTTSKSLWDEEVSLIESCHQNCFISENECICPEFQGRRKLMFFHIMNKNIRSGTKHKLLSSLSLETPWGLMKIDESFKPTTTTANLQLTWNSEEEVGDKIILSGKSTSILKLLQRTGSVWELSSPKASEKRKLIVSIMDYSQEYKTQFQYLTGDRVIGDWPKATCTGPCPDRCSCHTSTCFWKQWPNSRKWTCNPTWCWGVGTGCTCCGVDIEKPFQDYLVAKWSVDYMKTDVAVCVELSENERHCDVVQAGSRFHLGPVTVVVSDPQNVEKKLPSEILTIHKVKSGELDLMHVDKILSANNICKLQSCTHGSPGDMQIFKPDYLIKYSKTDKINTIDDNKWANDTWMSWQGCDLDYYCTTGSWPTCTFSGVVKQNTPAFQNLETVEIDHMKDFFFHSSKVEVKGGWMSLPLKARPNEGGGEMSVLVEVNGLELHSKLISPKGLSFKISSCHGCHSCSVGFTCDVVVGIEDPPEMAVHVEGDNPNIVVSQSSIIANRAGTSGKIRAFSTLKESHFCLVLLESKITGNEIKDCIDLKLDDPKDIIIETRSTLLSHQNDTCPSAFSCWASNTRTFFSGLGQFFGRYFGSWLLGTFLFLLPIVLLILFFCFGDKILFCRKFKRCFKRRNVDREKFKELLKNIQKGVKLNQEASNPTSWRHLANTALGKVKQNQD
nr:MAG: glycoprotein precursor [Cencurut virus]